jgi:hypothetical protein
VNGEVKYESEKVVRISKRDLKSRSKQPLEQETWKETAAAVRGKTYEPVQEKSFHMNISTVVIEKLREGASPGWYRYKNPASR